MDAHRADDLIVGDADAGQRDQRLRALVDRIAIVADEDALLDAEHRATQGEGLLALPARRRPLHAELAGDERRWLVQPVRMQCIEAAHGQLSYCDSEEQAPHLPQPALMSAERRP